jgi:hypothetical protein
MPPAHVVPSAELEADAWKPADVREPAGFVERDAGVVGQRDPGVSVHVALGA